MSKIITRTLNNMSRTRILGIDPGYGRVGFGIIEECGGNSWKPVVYGCIETSSDRSFVERILQIKKELTILIREYEPTRVAIEELFFFKNAKTAIEVGQARGVILLTAVESDLPVDEFTPLQVKQAMTGYGRAEKGQMQRIVAAILGMKEKIKSDDAADALAVALTSAQTLWLTKIK